MKYQIFSYKDSGNGNACGLLIEGQAYNLARLAEIAGVAIASNSIDELLENWDAALVSLDEIVACIDKKQRALADCRVVLDELDFNAPLVRPGNIYGAGANYRDHVEAMARAFNMKLSTDPRSEGIEPWHFVKSGRASVAAHKQAVAIPEGTKMLDWEAELAVVIGREASGVSVENALQYVAGYTCSNDLSARDHLRRDQVDPSSPFRFDWIGHKCFTGACPLGPFLTPAHFIATPENLGIKLWRNGKLEQNSNTSNHLYGVAEQISYLSRRMTLFPGDVILTGTPAGVGMESQTFLERGDVLKVWIDGLGELETTII